MELQIPTGLTDMLQEFTVVVLRERPEDMVDFAANYFTQLKLQNKGSENAKGVSFHSDQKESDEEDDEEEPLGSLKKFHTMTFVIYATQCCIEFCLLLCAVAGICPIVNHIVNSLVFSN
jgi:hypothetical protein